MGAVLTEIAREVGGADLRVTRLVQPGIDPHEFDPSPRTSKVYRPMPSPKPGTSPTLRNSSEKTGESDFCRKHG